MCSLDWGEETGVSQCDPRLGVSLQDPLSPRAGSLNVLETGQQAQHRQQPNGSAG